MARAVDHTASGDSRPVAGAISAAQGTVFTVLAALSFSHLLNDLISSLVPAVYPMLKTRFDLDFAQIGLITLTYQITASLLQPVVGRFTDRRPLPYSLPIGMASTLAGLLLLSWASTFPLVLIAAALIGTGSSVFHPESSRIAHAASGGQRGFAQSLFQMGGNAGQALGPLLAAIIIMPRGQPSIALFALVALLAIIVLTLVCRWYKRERNARNARAPVHAAQAKAIPAVPARRVRTALVVLLLLIFSKYFYLASLTSYYIFYLMDRFHVSAQNAQVHLFVFLGAAALGTFFGGPIGDRYGRKIVIWGSIVGVLPFTLMLPYADLFWTGVLTVVIGLILSSAFSAILVYATELIPGRIGMISGVFFGLAFGMAGIGAAVLGWLADMTSITFVYKLCAFLPFIGLLTGFLPTIETTPN
ncbi:MAG TPA: MFS transporter [Stellaceae bacterium]|nr:MFS transporter [Stellaceae bacterium]